MQINAFVGKVQLASAGEIREDCDLRLVHKLDRAANRTLLTIHSNQLNVKL